MVDLQCGENEDGTSWAKAVLYVPDAAGDGLTEAGCTESKEHLCGSWVLERDEITYTVNVIYGVRDRETIKLVPRRPSVCQSSREASKVPLLF